MNVKLSYTRSKLLLLITLLLPLAGLADRVTIVSDRWYPYNGIPHSPNPGYMIEIARYGLEKSGHKLNYQLMSWERSIDLVRKGEKNCIVGSYKSDAPDLMYSDKHQGTDQMAFYRSTQDDWQYEGVESLKNRQLGVIEGYTYQDEVDQYIADQRSTNKVLVTKGKYALEENLLDLVHGRLNTVIDSNRVIKQAINKQGWEKSIVFAGYGNTVSKIYVACSAIHPSSTEYLTAIIDGIDELRASGQLDVILKKYDEKDWLGVEAEDN